MLLQITNLKSGYWQMEILKGVKFEAGGAGDSSHDRAQWLGQVNSV